MRIKYDELCGWLLGIATVLFAGKCFILPDLSIIEILILILKGEIGWWW